MMKPMDNGHIRFNSATGRWVLLTTILGSGIALLDGTVVNVALPALGADLGADMAGLQWTVNAYTLTLAGLILLGGSLGDRFGRRKVFLIGVVWFALASVLCGLAPNVETLIGARALQGVGGALLTPGSLAIIQASFDREDRPKAIGAWSGFGGVAAAIGPLLGGWLVETAGWRWVFLINLPLAALVRGGRPAARARERDAEATGRFDVLGAALAALALAGITYGLIGLQPVPVVAGVLLGGRSSGWRSGARPTARAGRHLRLEGVHRRQRRHASSCTPRWAWCSSCSSSSSRLGGLLPAAAGSAMIPVTILMLLLSARSGELAKRIGPGSP